MALSMRPVVSKAVKTVVGRNPLLMPNLVFKAIRSPTAKPNEIVFRVVRRGFFVCVCVCVFSFFFFPYPLCTLPLQAPNMNKFEIKRYVECPVFHRCG